MNFYRTISMAVIGLLYASVSGQPMSDPSLEKRLPRVQMWTDNSHYVLTEYGGHPGETKTFRVDARNGKREAYALERRNAIAKGNTVRAMEGDLYVVEDGRKRRLTRTTAKEEIFRVSPDGKLVAFVRDNDLYTIDMATGKETRYTHDGTDVIMNGRASWVYYEEILGRDTKYAAFWWSPDSKHLAFYRFDDSRVPVFPIYNSMGQHGRLENTRYPKAGDPNPQVKVGVADVVTGTVCWADFDPTQDQYFGTPFWRPDGSGFLVQWMPREQNELRLYDVNVQTGVSKAIYDEKYPTWIDWIGEFEWVDDGFLMVRDYDGWQQIYYHRDDGSLKCKLTSGRNWKTEIVRVDERRKKVYYRSCAELSTRTDLYVVGMNGRRQKRLTFGEYTHGDFSLSPDGSYFITKYGNTRTPYRLALVRTSDGRQTLIADSKGPKLDEAGLKYRDMVWLKTKDGLDLPGCISWPLQMEEGKKYPVVVQVYGGPGSPSVEERWVSPRFISSDGVIRISIDHRGSGHCGKKGMDYMHRNLGKWEMADYMAWVEWLRRQPCVDADRILISGGSYGGYMAAMAVTCGAGYFQYAISEYPVVDWALYDSHYTERYMDMPKDNPEGYKAASVLTYLERYQSKGKSALLLQHGLMDDNVHVQNTFQLVDALQKLNKTFELMVYPNERHGWFTKLDFTARMKDNFINKCLELKPQKQ